MDDGEKHPKISREKLEFSSVSEMDSTSVHSKGSISPSIGTARENSEVPVIADKISLSTQGLSSGRHDDMKLEVSHLLSNNTTSEQHKSSTPPDFIATVKNPSISLSLGMVDESIYVSGDLKKSPSIISTSDKDDIEKLSKVLSSPSQNLDAASKHSKIPTSASMNSGSKIPIISGSPEMDNSSRNSNITPSDVDTASKQLEDSTFTNLISQQSRNSFEVENITETSTEIVNELPKISDSPIDTTVKYQYVKCKCSAECGGIIRENVLRGRESLETNTDENEKVSVSQAAEDTRKFARVTSPYSINSEKKIGTISTSSNMDAERKSLTNSAPSDMNIASKHSEVSSSSNMKFPDLSSTFKAETNIDDSEKHTVIDDHSTEDTKKLSDLSSPYSSDPESKMPLIQKSPELDAERKPSTNSGPSDTNIAGNHSEISSPLKMKTSSSSSSTLKAESNTEMSEDIDNKSLIVSDSLKDPIITHQYVTCKCSAECGGVMKENGFHDTDALESNVDDHKKHAITDLHNVDDTGKLSGVSSPHRMDSGSKVPLTLTSPYVDDERKSLRNSAPDINTASTHSEISGSSNKISPTFKAKTNNEMPEETDISSKEYGDMIRENVLDDTDALQMNADDSEKNTIIDHHSAEDTEKLSGMSSPYSSDPERKMPLIQTSPEMDAARKSSRNSAPSDMNVASKHSEVSSSSNMKSPDLSSTFKVENNNELSEKMGDKSLISDILKDSAIAHKHVKCKCSAECDGVIAENLLYESHAYEANIDDNEQLGVTVPHSEE